MKKQAPYLTQATTLILIVIILLVQSCKDDEVAPKGPEVTTTAAADVAATTAKLAGSITSDGGAAITAKGIVYAMTPNPTTASVKVEIAGASTTFETTLTGLQANTTYYARAFATNIAGTGYGNEVSFTTTSGLATVLLDPITDIGYAEAAVAISVTSDGASAVTNYGLVWSINENPTVSLTTKKQFNGSGNSSGRLIIGLNPNTTYFVRAYATNSFGVSYGTQVSIKTKANVTDVDGNSYNAIRVNNYVWMDHNLQTKKYANGDAIPTTTSDILSEATPKYYFNAQTTNLGILYTWFAATDSRGVCPAGWHVPRQFELGDLATTSSYALRETGTTSWTDSNGTNTSGFSAKGSGIRFPDNTYTNQNELAVFLSVTNDSGNSNNAASIILGPVYADQVNTYSSNKKYGTSVRCVADY